MKKVTVVTGIVVAHFAFMHFLAMTFGVRANEYLLWMILVSLTMMNYEKTN